MRLMGIEIGQASIKILEVSKHGTRLNIHHYSILDIPLSCIHDGVISNMALLQKLIQDEIKKVHYHAKKVVVVVHSSQIIVRNIWMQCHSEKVLHQLFEIHPEYYLPVKRNQYQIDFRILEKGESERNGQMKVEVVAAPNEVILPVTELVKSLKRIPIAMQPAHMALRSLFFEKPYRIIEHAPNVMVIDFGGYSTTVTLLTKKGEALMRVIPFGMNHIEGEQVEVACCLQRKKENQVISSWQWIGPQIEYHILSEIERILQFFKRYYQAGDIERIYLIGGGSHIDGLRGYIRDALNRPTERIEQLLEIEVSPKVDFEEKVSLFVNLVGVLGMY